MSWITRVLHSNHCHKRLKPTYTISLCSTAVSEATRIDKFCHAGLAENAACGVADTSNLHRAFVLNKTKGVMHETLNDCGFDTCDGNVQLDLRSGARQLRQASSHGTRTRRASRQPQRRQQRHRHGRSKAGSAQNEEVQEVEEGLEKQGQSWLQVVFHGSNSASPRFLQKQPEATRHAR